VAKLVHDFCAHDVLLALEQFGSFVEKTMLKHQHAPCGWNVRDPLARLFGREEHRLPALEPFVQIDEDGDLTGLATVRSRI